MIGESGFTNTGGVCVEANKSWEAWWEQEQEHLKSTGTLGRFSEIILALRFFILQYSVVYQMNITAGNKSFGVSFQIYLNLL